MRNISRRTYLLALAAAMFIAPAAASADFMMAGAGPYDYNNAANWDAAGINGVWNSGLTLTANQTVTFAADTVLSTGLSFNYAGGKTLTLNAATGSASYTVTLGGDISDTAGTVTIGNGSAVLNVDLGGTTRTFSAASGKTLAFVNTLSDGDFTVTGSGTVKLTGTAPGSNIVVNNGSTLNFDSSATGATGATRAGSVTLSSGTLSVNGNSGANSVDTIANALTIDRAGYGIPGVSGYPAAGSGVDIVTLAPNATRNATLSAGSLVQANNGVAVFRGTNLGVNTIASQTAGASNIQFTAAPTSSLIGGGGAAGTTNISIIPWAVGGTSSSDNGSTFVTYDANNGIRPLSTANEYDTNFVSIGSSTDHNVLMTAGSSYAVAANTTINSLLLQQNSAAPATTVSGTGTLTVSSGAILAILSTGQTQNVVISAPVAFANVTGYIGTALSSGNADLQFSGGISGTKGVVVYNSAIVPGAERGVQFNSANSYTGDTTVFGLLEINASGALPNFSNDGRAGDVNVYGNFVVNTATVQMNGLNGTGFVNAQHSGGHSLILGDNNANGSFDGVISGSKNLSLTKIGSGTQVLSGGNSTYFGSPTTILGGVLSVSVLANGGVNSSIGADDNTAGSIVINGGILRYTGAGASTDHLFQVGQTTTGATGTLDASGSGAINFTNTGALAYGTTGTTTRADTRTLALTGTNTGDNTLAAVIGDNGTATNGNSMVSVTKSGSGTWALNGVSTYSGATTITAGTLLVGDASNATASIAGSGVSVNGGTLGGYGTIASPVTVNTGGHLAPGASIGALTVSNTLTLAAGAGPAGSESDFEINSALDTNDQAAGMTTLTYGGNLLVTNLDGTSSYTNGETFTLFSLGTGGTESGFFDTITLPTLPTGFQWETFSGSGQNGQAFDYVNGLIAVQSTSPVPEPASLALLALGGVGLLLRRPRAVS